MSTPINPVQRHPLPLNLALLHLTPQRLKLIRPVTTLDIFDGRGGNFHDDGLFSTTTFGRVGDPIRDRRFGYIHLRIPVLHPLIYTTLCKLDALYKGIIHGTDYATFSTATNQFEKADALTGHTGMAFFMKHFPQLVPLRTGSSIRDVRVDKILKYKKEAVTEYWLVMPAGLREADFDSDGRLSMDEINDLYQGLLMQVRSIPDRVEAGTTEGIEAYDRTRLTITTKLVEIYQYIEKLLQGKRGFIQGRFASRRIFNSTRNVLTSMDVTIADLRKPNHPKFRSAMIGLNQATKNVLPKALFYLRTSIVQDVFDTGTGRVRLVDPSTLKLVDVEVSSVVLDTWTTMEGLERVINDLGVLEKRDRPIMVEEHYLALIYVDDQQNYRIFRDINELPENHDPAFVRPLTLMELIYLSGVDHWNTFPCFVTRYPVENMHSSVPCTQYVKTTQVGELRYRLNANWEREPVEGMALEFPVYATTAHGSTYYDSVSVPVTILAALGADFDGDTVSTIAGYSDEAMAAARAYFRSRRSLMRAGGGLAFNLGFDTLKLSLKFMTGEPA